MLHWVIGSEFENISTVSEKSLGLFQDYINGIMMLRVPLVIGYYRIMVTIAGYRSRILQFDTYGWPIFFSCFTKFVFRSTLGT